MTLKLEDRTLFNSATLNWTAAVTRIGRHICLEETLITGRDDDQNRIRRAESPHLRKPVGNSLSEDETASFIPSVRYYLFHELDDLNRS